MLKRILAALLAALIGASMCVTALAAETDDLYDEDSHEEWTEDEEAAEDGEHDDGSIEALLDSVELDPVSTGVDALDDLIDGVLDEIMDEDLTQCEQVKAVQDYLMENMSYGYVSNRYAYQVDDLSCNDIYYYYGALNGYGAVALTSYAGQCSEYAAAFVLMTRRLGFESRLIKGQTLYSGGRYMVHHWAEIEIDGTSYIFDPQLDQSFEAKGLGDYFCYGKTYDQLPGRFVYGGELA